MAIDKSLISGSMTMLILKLLSEKDMYGYEMIDTLRKKSQNILNLRQVLFTLFFITLKRIISLRYMSRKLLAKSGSITALPNKVKKSLKKRLRNGTPIRKLFVMYL